MPCPLMRWRIPIEATASMTPGACHSSDLASSGRSRCQHQERPRNSVKHGEKLAPVAAVVSAISCMACCLPLGMAAAAGAAGLGLVLEPVRPYLLAGCGGVLVFGGWAVFRSGERRGG